jgi:hypothetical protein
LMLISLLGAASPNWIFFFSHMNPTLMLRNAQNPYVRLAMHPRVLLEKTFDVENCGTFERIK